jgi:hypothetical protein
LRSFFRAETPPTQAPRSLARGRLHERGSDKVEQSSRGPQFGKSDQDQPFTQEVGQSAAVDLKKEVSGQKIGPNRKPFFERAQKFKRREELRESQFSKPKSNPKTSPNKIRPHKYTEGELALHA